MKMVINPITHNRKVEDKMTQKEMEEIDYALMGFLDKKSRLIVIEKMDEIGFTKRPQDNNLVPLDRDKLAKILAQHRGGHSGFPPASWDYDLADVICAKFGKDNSGMVPRAGLLTEDKADQVARDIYDLIHLTVKPPSGKEFGAYIECRGIAKALIDKYGFSQQPPKERNDNNNKLNGSFLAQIAALKAQINSIPVVNKTTISCVKGSITK